MPGSPPPLRRVIESRALPAPRFRYSPVVASGGFAFVAGMVALGADGGLVGGGAEAETARILANLKALADEQGWSLDQLLVARIYCTDFAKFADVNRAWEAFFAASIPPTRTSVGVAALPLGASVEIEFQFAV